MRRSIQAILVLSLLCGLSGCFGPDYSPSYGYPGYGYSPYSYGFPVYTSGYAPTFIVHHPWEEHHIHGHSESFYHPAPAAPHYGGEVGGMHPGAVHGGGHR